MLHDNVYQISLLEYTVMLFFVISDTKYANVTRYLSDEEEFNNFSKCLRIQTLFNIIVYLVDPASSHTLVLKIKPCMSKCFAYSTLDCERLIITVIVLLN